MNIRSINLINKIISNPKQFGLFCESKSIEGLDSYMASHSLNFDAIYQISKEKFHLSAKEAIAKEKASNENAYKYHWRYIWKWYFRYSLAIEIVDLILKVHDVLSYLELYRIIDIPWKDRNPQIVDKACILLIQLGFLCERYKHMPESDVLLASFDILHETSRYHSIITNGWDAIQAYCEKEGIEWFRTINTKNWKELPIENYLSEYGLNKKTLYEDNKGRLWLCKYDPECLVNPVFVSLIQELSDCPGSGIIRVYLSFDNKRKRLCSIQRFIDGSVFQKFNSSDPNFYSAFIGNSRSKATQIICQATTEWLVGNINGFQTITTQKGNINFIDQDRSFFFNQDQDQREKIFSALLIATLKIPGTMDILFDYIDRIVDIPGELYESFLYCSSPEANKLTTIFMEYWIYQNTFQVEFDKLTSQWRALIDKKIHLRHLIIQKIKYLCNHKSLSIEDPICATYR